MPSNTGMRYDVCPVISITITAVDTVCVAPLVSAAAPITAYTPAGDRLALGSIRCITSPKKRPAAAPRQKSGTKRPQLIGREMLSTVVINRTCSGGRGRAAATIKAANRRMDVRPHQLVTIDLLCCALVSAT